MATRLNAKISFAADPGYKKEKFEIVSCDPVEENVKTPGFKLKSVLLSLALVIIVSITSCFNYFRIRQIFWAAELAPFFFCAIACFFLLMVTFAGKGAICLCFIDIFILSFFLYNIVVAWVMAAPFSPGDGIYHLLGCTVFYCSIRIYYTRYDILAVLYGIFLVILFQCLWGLLQYFALLPALAGSSGVQGGFINPGIYGCFMAAGSLLSVYLISIYKGPQPGMFFLGIANLLIFTGLVLSHSRTAFLAALFCILVGCYIRGRKKWNLRFIRLISIFPLLLCVLFIGIAWFLWQQNMVSVSGRFLIWKISCRMFTEHPVWGMGYGRFFSEYCRYQAGYFQSGKGSVREMQTAGINYYPFNEFLRIIIESGLIGLLLFLFSVITACVEGWRQRKAGVSDTIPFLALIVVVLIFGMFSYPFQSTAINCLFIFSIAAIAASQRSVWVLNMNGIKRTFAVLPVLFLFLISIWKMNALLKWRTVENNILYAEGDALRNYAQINNVLDNNGAFLYNYGLELSEMGLNKESLEVLERARNYVSSVELSTKLAIVSLKLHQIKKANLYYLEAAYMDPKRFVPLNNLFLFYKQNGQKSAAQEIAGVIVNKPEKVPSAIIAEIKESARQYLSICRKTDKSR